MEYRGTPLDDEDGRWSLHSWTIQDNIAAPKQWKRALRDKKAAGWTDETPYWRREYLGEWVTDTSELVYAYAGLKGMGRVSWLPEVTGDNPTGLPQEHGPWNILMGLDFGYEDDCAIVMVGWSETKQELRQFYDWKSPHLSVDDFAEEVLATIVRFGQPDVIVGDKGALGKMIVESINQRHGLGIIAAEKTEKLAHIELLNSDFHAGRVKVVHNSDLDHELCGLQWKLDKDKKILIRTGQLKEDPKCPNHMCDCLLYVWRYAYHYWSKAPEVGVEKDSPEWWKLEEKRQLQAYRERRMNEKKVDYLTQKFKELRKLDSYRRGPI